MNMNHKEIDFELNRQSKKIGELLKDKRDLMDALRILQSECVNQDASGVVDSDAFCHSRSLLTKMMISPPKLQQE
jgi:hypothetical protein